LFSSSPLRKRGERGERPRFTKGKEGKERGRPFLSFFPLPLLKRKEEKWEGKRGKGECSPGEMMSSCYFWKKGRKRKKKEDRGAKESTI